MKQFELFIRSLVIQSLAASAVIAVAVWATLGAPPHQNGKVQFNVASRR